MAGNPDLSNIKPGHKPIAVIKPTTQVSAGDYNNYCFGVYIYAPTSKKLRGHIGLGLSIRLSIHLLHLHMMKNG